MGILDALIAALNEQEQEDGGEGTWVRIYSKPVEIVETPNGTVYRDTESGEFTSK